MRLRRRKLRSVGCVSDAPGIAIHSASALEGVDVATADQYRVAAIRMAHLARVVRALGAVCGLRVGSMLDGSRCQKEGGVWGTILCAMRDLLEVVAVGDDGTREDGLRDFTEPRHAATRCHRTPDNSPRCPILNSRF